MLEQLRQTLTALTPIDDRLWEDIEKNAKPLEVSKGETLIQFSTVCTDLFYIAKGSFVVSQITEKGESRAVWFHFEDAFEYMTSPDSFFIEESTKYEMKAMEASQVIKFSKEVVQGWVSSYPSFNRLFLDFIIRDFVIIYEARSSLLTLSTLEFLQYTQEKFPFIIQRLPSHYIADFLGITPEWYSKLKKKLAS
ncbi:MAG: Crp/Fnr family transcriptional regulator [Bacteroidota bacterium]